MATKLALDKSSAVLFIETEDEEEIGIEQSLKRYAEIKVLAEKLKIFLQKPMLSSNKKYFIKIPLKEIDTDILRGQYQEIITKYDSKPTEKVLKSQKNKINNIRNKFINKLKRLNKFKTDELTKSSNKTETIIQLLTILDLLKQGQLIYTKDHYEFAGVAR